MTHSYRVSRRGAVRALLGGVGLALLAPHAKAVKSPRVAPRNATYPYGSATFQGFVNNSYAQTTSDRLRPFREWLEAAFQQHGGGSLGEALNRHKAQLQGFRDLSERVALERAVAGWLHRMVKTAIPRFSLERGFEFAHTVRYGERQCLLQSVLIAALLQEVGLGAGVVMVWRNQEGKVSNNGHAVTLLRLADGRDLLVDASDPQPFMRHQGLFVWDPAQRDYRFVEARFAPDGSILGYGRLRDGRSLSPGEVMPLDTTFLHSQFDYYRGERTEGGFMGPSHATGLAASARLLERAQRQQPRNPLAVYVLGHVYRKQGRLEEARRQFRRGHTLYQIQGFVPEGPKAAYAWAQSGA